MKAEPDSAKVEQVQLVLLELELEEPLELELEEPLELELEEPLELE
eukprot:CAMPEP_0172480078 /NCGR_PEP_ID=MMETSP1066-20121228/5007_1 /TAXON_ID=671091 /ORGANISM="Coscinodiscus wailesii, Strain CCMP2513" /LENGTH=45 /DNA_ID= /DNA_START= /DNA_END= /DNA_ORIENTATION=